MIHPLIPAAAAALAVLVSCTPPAKVPPPRFTPNPPYAPVPVDPYGQPQDGTQPVDPYGNPGQAPPTTPPPTRPGEYPTAQRTANPNEVVSPYEPYNLIDVEGFTSGQLARDPSNQKIFRVP